MLDLCTGTADLAIAAARARPAAARVVGVDFAGAMLRVGREKLQRERLGGRVALVRGDATRIPIADASVDAVTIAFGIRNVEQVAVACREMRRVLRRGGRLAILEFAVPTTPGVERGVPVVSPPRPAADRPRGVASQRRVRLPAGVDRRILDARMNS